MQPKLQSWVGKFIKAVLEEGGRESSNNDTYLPCTSYRPSALPAVAVHGPRRVGRR